MSDPEYDVFVSFKNLDADGRPTPDAALARLVYDHLTAHGLRVFFSEVSLEGHGSFAYKRAIDAALDSAQVLVVVGTSGANLESEWVRYEWDTFYGDILSGVKPQGRVFSYVDGMPLAALPRSLRNMQAITHQEGSLERLLRFIMNSPPAPAAASARTTVEPARDEKRRADRAGRALSRWLRGNCWVGYDPASFDPLLCSAPSIDSIRRELAWIREAGFTGVVTFSSCATFAEIPRLAKEQGLAVIMGVWDACNEEELALASERGDIADAYCVGHNGLRDDRYDLEDLDAAVQEVRAATSKPVTTSEEIRFYRNNAPLAALGDWLFPDAHVAFRVSPGSDREADLLDHVQRFVSLAREVAPLAQELRRPLALKMVVYPWAGDGFSLELQRRFFQQALETLASPDEGLEVPAAYVVHGAFDAPWKCGGPFHSWDAYTGLLAGDGTPRSAVHEIVSRRWYAT